jgi:hypothetical protein
VENDLHLHPNEDMLDTAHQNVVRNTSMSAKKKEWSFISDN